MFYFPYCNITRCYCICHLGVFIEILLPCIYLIFSCFALLEFKLSQGRANLVGFDLSLADFSWAPIVHQALLMRFPMLKYPHVLMWFDIVGNSATFYRAVTAWGNWRLESLLKLRVGEFVFEGVKTEVVALGVYLCMYGLYYSTALCNKHSHA